MKTIFWFCLLSLLSIGFPLRAQTAVAPSVSAISDLAIATIQEKLTLPDNARVNISPQSLDSRLAIPRCSSPLTAELASDREISRNNTLKISCQSPDLPYPWQIFISVRVDILYPVVVALQPLSPGDIISTDSVKLEYVEQTNLRGQQFDAINQVEGTRVKRRIAPNQAIYNTNLCFVCKGDIVSIYARTPSFTIKTTGEALSDGNFGDRIQVRNSKSSKMIEANVMGTGEVEVRM
ncbi:flagellar basal body P-ring formation protein FlgA [Shewanella sp. AS1]|uniref:flagellar basal body P-ring formation chaperone FlgA n=1 Tax=Shewanella sp. AS1 TaxID=2907626 RepID=UPI001F41BCDF|nr:flagellar basal body P-ring formation chaperone FlgA [Shewanella sp. AS1]MCE9679992.1 flagellar basal body P-ring formation protein FlgA [Shewanella sp. AS1]